MEQGTLLIVGGAGYIGSHIVQELTKANIPCIVLDDLSTGHREAVRDVELVVGSVTDSDLLDSIFRNRPISGAVHLAGPTAVGDSMEDPLPYYEVHVVGTHTLVAAMQRHGVPNLVYSSSSAVYGNPSEVPIQEDHPLEPISPYGRCKHIAEQLLRDADAAYGLRSVSLRYFNAAGANWEDDLGEDHDPETHLIPRILRVAQAAAAHGDGRRESAPEPMQIYGDDYATHDGTCVRDYIHVVDLARAHLLAMDWLAQGGATTSINLGTKKGASVKEVVAAVETASGIAIPAEVVGRRAGDPPLLIAEVQRARELLGWEPIHSDLHHIVETAWRWCERRPLGFASPPQPAASE